MNSIWTWSAVLGILVLSPSCEKQASGEAWNLTASKDKLGSLHGNVERPNGIIEVKESSVRALVGQILRGDEVERHDEWIEILSLNAIEKAHRIRQFTHIRRVEIVDWDVSKKDFQSLADGEDQREIEIPFFSGDKLVIHAKKIHHYGTNVINVAGFLSNDASVKVNFNLSEMQPIGVVEGAETLYYYEYFEGVVIIFESEPGSQHPEYNCACDFHSAER